MHSLGEKSKYFTESTTFQKMTTPLTSAVARIRWQSDRSRSSREREGRLLNNNYFQMYRRILSLCIFLD